MKGLGVRSEIGTLRIDGALSGLVEEAILETLGRFETTGPSETFRAVKDGKVLAEADNLDHLALKLKKLNVNARSVRILSSSYLPAIARAGFGARKT